MFRKGIAILLAVLICIPSLLAGELPDAPSATLQSENLKKSADVLGHSGKNAAITLNNGNKIKGRVTTVTTDGFILSTNDGMQKQFSFTQVKSIQKAGLSTKAKVGIGVAAGVGVGILGLLVKLAGPE